MKTKVTGIVVVAALLVVVGALLLFFRLTDVEEEGEYYFLLGSEKSPAAQEIHVQNELGEFTVTVDNPEVIPKLIGQEEIGNDEYYELTCTLVGFEEFEVDQIDLGSVAKVSTAMTASSRIEKEGANLADYGLDTPRATIDITYVDGTTAQLLIGDPVANTENTYVMSTSADNICLARNATLKRFLYEDVQFITVYVTEGSPALAKVQKVTLGGRVRKAPIVLAVNPNAGAAKPGGLTAHEHIITSPVRAEVPVERRKEIISPVFRLESEGAVAVARTDEELESFGLLDPWSTVSMESDHPGNFTLIASEPDEEGNVYLMYEGRAVVYKVAGENVPWLNAQAVDLMDPIAAGPFIDTLSAVTITADDEVYRFELSGEGDALSVTHGGEPIDTGNFRAFYENMVVARFEDEPEEPLSEEAAPFLQFTYEYRDGSSSDTVSFYPGPTRKAFIRSNDREAYLVTTLYSEKILSDLAVLLSGGKVTPYL